MNFKKAMLALSETKGVYTVEQALSHPHRWNDYWMLYSTEESKVAIKTEQEYNQWVKWTDFIRSKSE